MEKVKEIDQKILDFLPQENSKKRARGHFRIKRINF